MVGNRQELPVKDYKVNLQLSEESIYLEGATEIKECEEVSLNISPILAQDPKNDRLKIFIQNNTEFSLKGRLKIDVLSEVKVAADTISVKNKTVIDLISRSFRYGDVK